MAMSYTGGFNGANLSQSFFRRANQLDVEVIKAIDEAATLIMEESKANAPVDTHNLEEAHHLTNRKTRRGNHAVDIEVSGSGGSGRDVDEYAMEMHEGDYNLGPGSQAKQAGDATHTVGRKYLERAVDEKHDEAVDKVRQAIKRTM